MKNLRLLLWVYLVCVGLSPVVACATESVRIGVLAFRPKPQTLEQWQPLAVVLKQAIPEYDFSVEAMTYPELEAATAARQLDFVLTNPAHYILLSNRSGLSAPLATLVVDESGQPVRVFGGVIFARAERDDINGLLDVKQKTIAAINAASFGGYQMQAYELAQKDIHLEQDAKLLLTGMPHDNVIDAVLSGRADVGFVRTGVLESMAREGNLDVAKLKIINPQKLTVFPVQISTQLYPEWAFSATPQVDPNLARKVAAVLFTLADNSAAIKAMNIHGFDVPADYTPVAEMLKELRLPPFDAAPSFTLKDVWLRYSSQLMVFLLLFAAIVVMGLRLFFIKRKLQAEHNITLQQQVQLTERELHLRTIVANEPECIKIVSAQGDLLEMNPAGLAMLEADSLEQLALKPVQNIIAPEYRQAFNKMHKRVIAGEAAELEFEVIGLKGGRRWLETHAVPLKENGETVHLAVTLDITRRKEAEVKLRMLSTAIEQGPTSVAIANLKAELVYVNTRFTKVTGYSQEEAIGQNPRVLQSGLTDPAVYDEMWAKLTKGESWTGEFVNKRKNGEIYSEEAYISPVKDDDGVVSHYVAVKLDITERKKMEEQVRQLAFYDTLTNLPNRRLLSDRLSQAMAAGKRSNNYGALMFLDLDNFKPLNDTHGHAAGDMLLIEAARRLESCMRDMDTVARFGGDEFVVMLTELDADKTQAKIQAEAVAEKIHAVLSEPYVLTIGETEHSVCDIEHRCTASIGVALFLGHKASLDDVMKWADVAMYTAKDAGRNQIRFWPY